MKINELKNKIKNGLTKCTDGEQIRFRQMYRHEDLTTPINDVVDQIPEHKLSWALKQVMSTVEKNIVSGVAKILLRERKLARITK